MNKSEIRKIFKEKRSAISKQKVELLSNQICENFLFNLLPKISIKQQDQVIALYKNSANEVSTKKISEHLLLHQISFCYPKIIAKNRPLNFIALKEGTEFKPNKIYSNILEPDSDILVTPNLLVLPLVAFDSHNIRLGMGGGFYDRTINFLKSQKFQFVTIGLAYDFQRLDGTMPFENHDQRLDFIVTEKNLFCAESGLA